MTTQSERPTWVVIDGAVYYRTGIRPKGDEPTAVLAATVDTDRLVALLSNVEEAVKLLPPEEREAYARAQQSIVDARDYAQRHAHEYWVG